RRQREQAHQLARERTLKELADFHDENARGESTRALVAVCLEASGYIRYQRNPWRRRRMKALPNPGPAPTRAEVKVLIKKVRENVDGALPDLYELASRHPDIVVRATFVDLEKLAFGFLIDKAFGGDLAMECGMRTKVKQIITSLAGDDP